MIIHHNDKRQLEAGVLRIADIDEWSVVATVDAPDERPNAWRLVFSKAEIAKLADAAGFAAGHAHNESDHQRPALRHRKG